LIDTDAIHASLRIPEEVILSGELMQHGEAISRLLNDTTIQKVFQDLDLHYFKQWKDARKPEERELLWAKASALGDFKTLLVGTVSSGLQERAQQQARERAAEGNQI
jgi:hypothetical protein